MSEHQSGRKTDPTVSFVTGFRVAREAQGITRRHFAELMRARGFNWHESVIPKIENETRSVKVGEALAIADILHTTVEELASDQTTVGTTKLNKLLADFESNYFDLMGLAYAIASGERRYEELAEKYPDDLGNFSGRDRLKSFIDRDVVAYFQKLYTKRYNA